MIRKSFQLNEETLGIVEQIGEHIPGGFFLYKAEGDGEILYVNRALLSIFGCDALEEFKALTGYTFKGLVYPEDYEAIQNSIDQQIGEKTEGMDYVEYRIVRKDGQIRWLDDYGHFTKSDIYGGIYYVFVSDITEKRMNMESDRATYLAVIDALSRTYNTMWLINDVETEHFSLFRGQIGEESPHAAPIQSALTRMKYSQAKEAYINATVAEKDRERLQEELKLSSIVKNTPEEGTYSVDYLRSFEREGKEDRYYRIDFAKVAMPDGKLGIVAGFKDIDEEVRKEQKIQQTLRDAIEAANSSNRAKSDFLSSMSHDIRTPMNGIIGMTAIAATHLDDRERVADCLRKITDSSKHLLGLINEVLDMNKIESGKVELNEEEFVLSELIDNLVAMTRTQIQQHSHTLKISITDVEHEKVIGDPRRLQQVFVNLMSNAIKYTPDGGHINLTISEKATNVPGTGCFTFVFEDNGYGMKPEFLTHLFEPFSRANDQNTASIQGTGLGMAITRNIVQMMGGNIQVESTYGKGSKFTVLVYLKLQSDTPIDTSAFTDLRILVTDDDPVSCEAACTILNDLGMNSEWALSGRTAVEKVKQRHEQGRDFYAVIVDWKMPDMDGLMTTRAIREIVGNDVPIIIISAYDWADIEQEAKEAGVNGFISKPLFKTKIAALFHRLMGDGKDPESGRPLLGLSELNMEGHRVLLAEDHPINAEIAQNVLHMAGLEVDWVKDGQEAVEKIRRAEKGTYDLVFMDIQMPVMNGYEAARAIRAIPREDSKKLPIVAMTANAFADDVQAARDAGMNGHIAKPLDFAELARVLQRWIP